MYSTVQTMNIYIYKQSRHNIEVYQSIFFDVVSLSCDDSDLT